MPGDMLDTCNFGRGKKGGGMTQAEYAAQFAVYAVLASPIVITADLRSLDQTQPDCLKLLKNRDLLAVSQDIAAHAPQLLFTTEHNSTEQRHGRNVTATFVVAQGFSRTLADGSVALVLLNRGDNHRSGLPLSASWAQMGLPTAAGRCTVRDLLAGIRLPDATTVRMATWWQCYSKFLIVASSCLLVGLHNATRILRL
jgi:hypothetical protein